MAPAAPLDRASIGWTTRAEPLTPVAVCAFDLDSGRLATATMNASARGRSLAVAAGKGALLVVGEADALPWVDGAVYLGDVGGVLVPCVDQPFDEVVVVRAARTHAAEDELVVVLPGRLLRVERPRPPVDVAGLAAFAERWR